MKTNAQKQADLRVRRRKAGLVKLELWAKPEHRQALKEQAKRLQISSNVLI